MVRIFRFQQIIEKFKVIGYVSKCKYFMVFYEIIYKNIFVYK